MFELFEVIWGIENSKYLVMGVTFSSARFGNHKNEGLSGSPKVKAKSYKSKMKQNNYTQRVGYSFRKTCSKNDPPPRPKNRIFLGCPGFSVGHRILFAAWRL